MIAEGFRNAANVLVFQSQDDESFLDSLVYPIAFNYRHAMELKLKSALLLASLLERKPKQPPATHDLDRLWQKLKPHVVARFASEPDYPRIPEIEDVLADFVAVDSNSFAFRYATDRKGNATLKGLSDVNVTMLQERANLLYGLLDVIGGVFDGDWRGCAEQ